MMPRQRLTSVPYALESANAGTLEGKAAAFYRNASNFSAGTLSVARLGANSIDGTKIADGGVGAYALTWDRDFANATYAVGGIPVETGNAYLCGTALAVGTFAYELQLNDGTPSDKNHTVIAIGDQ